MKKVINLAKQASKILLAYLVFFTLNEILISGGKSEQNIYLIIFNIIVILTISYFLKDRYYGKALKQRLAQGIIYSLTFAILDFLLVVLLLKKMDFSMYKSYYTYIYYGLLLLVPVLADYINYGIKKALSRTKKQSPLDKPDSNHIIR